MIVRSQQMLKLVLGVLGVLVIGAVGLCGYNLLTASSLQRDTDQQRQTIRREKREAAEIHRMQHSSESLAVRIVSRPSSWSWNEQLPGMMAQVSLLADHNGVDMETVQPAPSASFQTLTRYPLRTTLHTDLQHLTSFLQGLRQETPMLAVDQLTIRTGQNAGDPLQVDLTLSAYINMENRAGKGERR